VIFLICVDKAAEIYIYAGYVGVLLINQNYINVIKKTGRTDGHAITDIPGLRSRLLKEGSTLAPPGEYS